MSATSPINFRSLPNCCAAAIISRDFDQHLAEVLALEHAEERGGRVLQALDNILAILEATGVHSFAGIAEKIGLLGSEIRHYEAAHREALAQHREHVRPGNRRGRVVLGD